MSVHLGGCFAVLTPCRAMRRLAGRNVETLMALDPPPSGGRRPSRAVRRMVAKYRASGADLVDDQALVDIARQTIRVRRQAIAAVLTALLLVAGLILLVTGHSLLGGL